MFISVKAASMLFQLTAARRRLATAINVVIFFAAFQLTAARRRLVKYLDTAIAAAEFQLTAARRRLDKGAYTWL